MTFTSKWNLRVRQTLLIGLLLGFAFLSASIAFSSALLVQPKWLIEQWETKKITVDIKQANKLSERISRSIALYQNMPSGYLLQARLQLLVAMQLNQPEAVYVAIEHAKQAITLQPSDYHGWSLLALANLKNLSKEAHSQKALSHALTIAPFEKTNQVRLLPLIISRWTTLTPNNQIRAMTMIEAALQETHTAHVAVNSMIKHQNIRPFLSLKKSAKLQKKLQLSLEATR